LYVTHDLPETRGFDRVVVIERGRLVEEGLPHQLANTPSSRYRRLLQAHEITQNRFGAGEWRRIRLEGGHLISEHGRSSEQTA
jgi:ATP-binding cassette subfamily B protein